MDWDHFSDQEIEGFLANYPHFDTLKIICIGVLRLIIRHQVSQPYGIFGMNVYSKKK